MKCNAVISPMWESKTSTQQSAVEMYCCGVPGRDRCDPSVASSESEFSSPFAWMSDEITEVAGCVGLE